MKFSKLSTKFQATIPKEIRDFLDLKSGDSIAFQILDNNNIVIKKTKNFDKAYMQALNQTLSEWASEADDKTFECI